MPVISPPNMPHTPLRLVLDTNIVMDLLHFADRRTAALADGLAHGRLQCFTDGDCLAELERVCAYPEFGLEAAGQATLLERYRQMTIPCAATAGERFALPACRDADDQKFLILAARSRARLLISRDKELLRLAHCRLPFAIVTAETAAGLLPR